MNTCQSEDFQLGDLYTQVTDRLLGTELMDLDEFLDPLDEIVDVDEPDLSDIIVDFSEENASSGDGGGD
jgi:hypothetical protein